MHTSKRSKSEIPVDILFGAHQAVPTLNERRHAPPAQHGIRPGSEGKGSEPAGQHCQR
jgi:hypothetical protein